MLKAPANVQPHILRSLFEFFIYSELPYNITKSRFEIRVGVLIDTNPGIGSVANQGGLGFPAQRSQVWTLWLRRQYKVWYKLTQIALLFGVTNRTSFFCFIQPWLQTWTDGANLGKKDKPTEFRSTLGLSAAFSSWIFSQSQNDFWRCMSIIELQYAPNS